MGKVLLVSTKVGTSLFALCSTSVTMLSPPLFTDSDFDSVNTNQSKISTGSKQRTPCRLLPALSKEKKKYMHTPQRILRRPSSMFGFNLSPVKYESTALYCYLYKSETAPATGKLVLSYRL